MTSSWTPTSIVPPLLPLPQPIITPDDYYWRHYPMYQHQTQQQPPPPPPPLAPTVPPPTYINSWRAPIAFPQYNLNPVMPDPLPSTSDLQGLLRAVVSIPRFIYISLLLFLPFFYQTRVHQIFLGVSLTENEIASHYVGGPPVGSLKPRHWEEVKRAWSDFIDSTLKEWNTLNIVSVLLDRKSVV